MTGRAWIKKRRTAPPGKGRLMDRAQLERFIAEKYGAAAEYLWQRYPNYMIFRHGDNRKWFAAVMDISQRKLGLAEDKIIDVLNVKCDPVLIGSLRGDKGFFPAYHMSKDSWLTVAQDVSVDEDKIIWLLDMSFRLTAKRQPKKA